MCRPEWCISIVVMINLQIVFLLVSVCSALIPLWAGRKNKRSLLWLYVATGLFFDLLINVNKRVFDVNYFWLANIFILCEFLYISFAYRPVLFNKQVIFYTVILSGSLFFITGTAMQSIWKFNTSGASLFYFIYIVYSVAGLYKLLVEQKFLFLEKSGIFWMHCAFLIYGSGNFLLFLFSDYLMAANNELFRTLWSTFFLIINTTLNLLLAVALSRKHAPGNEFK